MREFTPLVFIVAGLACIDVGVMSAQPPGMRHGAGRAEVGVTAFRDVRVFDGAAMIERATVIVRDGHIAELGPDVRVPDGAAVVDGAGHTLLPGLIDAHAHTFGTALERALVFGVTTVIDMFTDYRQAAEWRREQQAGGGVPHRADILSAGTMVTAPKGHGTQYGMLIPTLESPTDAAAFVDARLAEGSDFIKVVYDDGEAHGGQRPGISRATLRAVIAAVRARDRRVVVHVSSRSAAETALAAGAHGLVHVFADAEPTPAQAALATKTGAFVIPTLSVIESVTGTSGSAALLDGGALAPYFLPLERSELEAIFPANPWSRTRLSHAIEATRQLHAAGVPILAGSDAPNPGTLHGATLHRELELLVTAGLTPEDALRAATSVPARSFGLDDRGRIAPGLRADLVLVEGNPARDITATRRPGRAGGIRLRGRRARRCAQAGRPRHRHRDAGAQRPRGRGRPPSAGSRREDRHPHHLRAPGLPPARARSGGVRLPPQGCALGAARRSHPPRSGRGARDRSGAGRRGVDRAGPLTERERQVLRLAGEGLSGDAIARQLDLSEGTVRNYLSEAIGKLGAKNRIEAARMARQKGWL